MLSSQDSEIIWNFVFLYFCQFSEWLLKSQLGGIWPRVRKSSLSGLCALRWRKSLTVMSASQWLRVSLVLASRYAVFRGSEFRRTSMVHTQYFLYPTLIYSQLNLILIWGACVGGWSVKQLEVRLDPSLLSCDFDKICFLFNVFWILTNESFQEFTASELKKVAYSKRRGQFGYFIPQEVESQTI